MVAETFLPNPDNLPYIDHIDRNPSNSDLSNLRWCTHSNNLANRPGWEERKYDLPRNVYKHGNKYRVSVKQGYKLKHYGTFATIAQAEELARKVVKDVFVEFAYVAPTVHPQ